jgi:hypothetical protein
MMSIEDVYRQAWTGKYGLGSGWTANWPPVTTIALGQRGEMINGLLRYEGYVKDYGVPFDVDPTPPVSSGPWDFTSSSDVSFQVGVNAALPGWEWIGNASAGVSVSFGKTAALLLSASDVSIERIADITKLKNDLITIAREHGMPIGQSVVVERQLAKQAEIIASQGGTGEFKATTSMNVSVPGAPGVVGSLAGTLSVTTQTGSTTEQNFPGESIVLAYRVVTLVRGGWLWSRHVEVQGIVATPDDDGDYFVKFS